jgi:hypothetical protein
MPQSSVPPGFARIFRQDAYEREDRTRVDTP